MPSGGTSTILEGTGMVAAVVGTVAAVVGMVTVEGDRVWESVEIDRVGSTRR